MAAHVRGMGHRSGNKRRSAGRNKLGRGQETYRPRFTVGVSNAMNSVRITFDQGVVISGNISLNVDPFILLVSQVVNPDGSVQQEYIADVTGHTWEVTPDVQHVRSFLGAGCVGQSGSF